MLQLAPRQLRACLWFFKHQESPTQVEVAVQNQLIRMNTECTDTFFKLLP